jgi:hypothetical protein
MKLTVRAMLRRDIYRDMVRIPEAHRIDIRGNTIPEAAICKLSQAGVGKLLFARGTLGVDRAEVFLDEKTRNDLKVNVGQEYDFKIRNIRWLGHILWCTRASDPAYRESGEPHNMLAATVLDADGFWRLGLRINLNSGAIFFAFWIAEQDGTVLTKIGDKTYKIDFSNQQQCDDFYDEVVNRVKASFADRRKSKPKSIGFAVDPEPV